MSTFKAQDHKNKMELLAPAGSLEVFAAAVEQGADAVYVGAPGLNARALAGNFSNAEIGSMISYAHSHGVKVYLAMNSLLKEDEIPAAVDMLAMLQEMKADALILQDLGIYYLARKYFPGLRLHASTLFSAHNSLSVRQFADMGFNRVVLARELTLEEIRGIRRASTVEIEVFVQGAMCFGYSGLCLFSSYLGGKSGLRGRCVQPCRRRYTWSAGRGRRSGYMFSMNDLSGLDFIDGLRGAGVGSLKIEGRMRNARYVGAVVRAYRRVLDAGPGDRQALAEAGDLLAEAMGRTAGPGYLPGVEPRRLLSPQHSGNIGLFLGRIERMRGQQAVISLRRPVRAGDRLRLHQEKSGERFAFTLKGTRTAGREETGVGGIATLEVPPIARPGDSLYLVDSLARRSSLLKKRIRVDHLLSGIRKTARLKAQAALRDINSSYPAAGGTIGPRRGKGKAAPGPVLPWWLKVDDLRLLGRRFTHPPDRIAVALTSRTHAQYLRMGRMLRPYVKKIVWCLPPIIEEGRVAFYDNAIRRLRNAGFHAWQIAHVSQFRFFKAGGGMETDSPRGDAGKRPRQRAGSRRHGPRGGGRIRLYGDYTLNVLNSQALMMLNDLGLNGVTASIETDSDNLRALCAHRGDAVLGFTVYARPAVCVARPWADNFRFDRPVVSPKGEKFFLRREDDLTLVLPEKNFSLLHELPALAAMGVRYAVVDLCHMNLRRGEMEAIIRGVAKGVRKRRDSSFNYNGRLL